MRERFGKFIRNCDVEAVAAKLVIVSLVLLPVVEFFVSLLSKQFFLQEEIVEIFGLLSFAGVGVMMWRNKKIEIYLSDILLGMLFGLAIISFIFSKDIMQSIFGHNYDYRETILVVFSYYSVAVLTSRISNTHYRKKILHTFFVLGIIETLVGILQFLGCWPFAPLFDPHTSAGESAWGVQEWAFGFTEHFNFFAALTVVFTALAAGRFLICEGKRSVKYFLLAGFFFFGVMTTYTRIGWLGTIGFWCFLILLCIVAKKIKKSRTELNIKKIMALLLLFGMIFAVSVMVFPELQYNIFESVNEIQDENRDRMGNSRMKIWREGLETVPEWWYAGTGFDNYIYSFYWDNPDYKGFTQSKGHNEYIHILVTQGVFALATLLTMIIYNLYTSSKRYLLSTVDEEENKVTFTLLIMYAGYLCQALANSSVTNVAIYNWVITGLLLYVADKKVKWSLPIKERATGEEGKPVGAGSMVIRRFEIVMTAIIVIVAVFLT